MRWRRGTFTRRRSIHWLHTPDGSLTSGTLESEKKPLENRVWYLYPGQRRPHVRGNVRRARPPSAAYWTTARRRSGSTSTTHEARRSKEIDPLGRETVYVYGTNNVPDANPATGEGIDLLQVKRKNGGSYDVLQSYTYNDKHQPLTITDARGATTTYTYNAAGQVLTVTTPPAQGHSQGRDDDLHLRHGRLPHAGERARSRARRPPSPTTPTAGSARRRTRPGLTLTYDYDALDRVTRVTYPDTTYEETVYKWLDAEKRRDRLGQWTQTFYDALRRPVATRDAAGGTTQYQYGGAGCSSCAGGGDRLTKLIDANGNATTWDYDLQGRVTQETRADGEQRELHLRGDARAGSSRRPTARASRRPSSTSWTASSSARATRTRRPR